MRKSALGRLHWTAPSRAFPHGLSGVLSVGIGAYLIFCALRGDLEAASRPEPLLVYAVSSFANAGAGLAIVNRAPQNVRHIFRSCAIFHISLVYCACRFSPAFPFSRSSHTALIDGAASLLLVLGIASIAAGAVARLPAVISAAVVFGSFALMLLAGYPLQLAILGQEWWECVQADYEHQGAAMTAYIYVPATWAFAVMLFGATLWSRKVIGDLALGGGFAGLVLATLSSTVLMQEVHFPEPASTQKLWLPCPPPPSGSWSEWAVTHLDTSALARSVLTLLCQNRA